MGRGVGGVPQSTRPPPPRARGRPSTRTAPCLRGRAGPLGPHGSCPRGRPPAPSSRRGTSPPPPLWPYSGTRSCAEPHFRQESGLFRVPMPRHVSRESPVSLSASWLQRNTRSILRANHGSSARSPSRDGCHPKKSQILTRRPILLARAQPVTARLARAVTGPSRGRTESAQRPSHRHRKASPRLLGSRGPSRGRTETLEPPSAGQSRGWICPTVIIERGFFSPQT